MIPTDLDRAIQSAVVLPRITRLFNSRGVCGLFEGNAGPGVTFALNLV